MPPEKSNRKNNSPPTNLPPPPPQYDPIVFQPAVTAVVAAVMLEIHASGTSGAGSGANPSNQGDSHGHLRECHTRTSRTQNPSPSMAPEVSLL